MPNESFNNATESGPKIEFFTTKYGDRVALRTDKAAFDAIGAGAHHYGRLQNQRIGSFLYQPVGVGSKFDSSEEPKMDDPNLCLWIRLGSGPVVFVSLKSGETVDDALNEMANNWSTLTPEQQMQFVE